MLYILSVKLFCYSFSKIELEFDIRHKELSMEPFNT